MAREIARQARQTRPATFASNSAASSSLSFQENFTGPAPRVAIAGQVNFRRAPTSEQQSDILNVVEREIDDALLREPTMNRPTLQCDWQCPNFFY